MLASPRRTLRPRGAVIAAAALAGAALLAGCGGDDVSGSVDVAGSSTLLPMASSVAGTFAAAHPLARINLEMTGTGEGIAALCDGTAAIAGASREMSDREKKSCAASGITPVRLQVARDALVFFTRKGSPAPACLSPGDIYALAGPEAPGLRRWSDARAVASAVGGSAKLPAAPLLVVAPGEGSGTRKLVEESVIGPIATRRSTEPGLRPDAASVPSDQVMLGEVLKVPAALAFAGFATVEPWGASVRTISITGDDGCVAPTGESIRDGSYPLSRPLYLYVDPAAARESATVRAFTDAMLRGGAQAGEGGNVLYLDPAAAQATVNAWDAAVSDGDVTGT